MGQVLNKRLIIIYWILLLVPTVIICIVAFRLLAHEQERINAQALSSLSDRVTSIAETIQLTVEDVEDTLTRSLLMIPDDRIKETLLAWENSNPLVRNVFLWKAASQLTYPVSGLASTEEERRFMNRFRSLFSGRIAWEYGDDATFQSYISDVPASSGISPSSAGDRSKKSIFYQEELSRSRKDRQNLRELAKIEQQSLNTVKAVEQSDKFSGGANTRSGWIPWFAENRLFILGWVQKDVKGPVYGVELELMTLLSRLIAGLPRLTLKDTAYALVGGNGQLLHQMGDFPVDLKQKPGMSIPISERLPHWHIRVYYKLQGGSIDRGFLYMSGILLAIFFIAIVSGGALLTWQAHRNMKDAVQKTSFVSSVSHELKTPLTSIRMYAELLQTGRIKAPEKVSHYLSVIVAESQRLTRLVNNVLDFGRLEEGKKKYNPEPFDLATLLYELVDAHGIRIRNAGMRTAVQVADKEMSVIADRDAIEQVILNLIDNAVKYASAGNEIALILDYTDDGFYQLMICDRGPGIPVSQKEMIFEKFHRVDNSLTSRQPGSGLGLSIARRILRDLGGDLLYRPRDKGGSVFEVRIRKNE